jgi:Ca-activated chloride channel family protein
MSAEAFSMTSRRAALLTMLAGLGSAQTIRKKPAPPKEEKPTGTLRVDTTLVLIPVTVNDPLNRPVTGLEKENFRLFDEKVEQTITQFAMDDEPVAVGLVFDTSGSMGEKLRTSRLAAKSFFRTSNEDDDEYFLVEFDSAPRLVVPMTTNTGEIETQLLYSKSKGSTALLDALLLAIHEMRKSKKRKKALLVISDGGDNHSRYTANEAQRIIRESDLLIYAIGVFGGGSTMEEYGGPRLLSKIAEGTGGRLYEAVPAELPDIAQKIGIDLRNRYILGYQPTHQERDGKYHRVDVRIVPPRGLPKLHAHWRTGYYAPSE